MTTRKHPKIFTPGIYCSRENRKGSAIMLTSLYSVDTYYAYIKLPITAGGMTKDENRIRPKCQFVSLFLANICRIHGDTYITSIIV